MEDVLSRIRDYADRAHAGQKRKYTPERYIVHPVRVMELCSRFTNHLPVLAAALLHDVLEDTPVTREEMHQYLRSVMSDEDARTTIDLVTDLTDIYTKEAYPQWNRSKRKELERERMKQISAGAQTIKYADIIDNCTEIMRYDKQFGPKFLKECSLLLRVMNKGDQALYLLAQETLRTESQRLCE